MRERAVARAGDRDDTRGWGRAGILGLLLALVVGLLAGSAGGAAAQSTPVEVTGTLALATTGDPVPGARLEFTVPSGNGSYTTAASTTTDQQGRYAVQVPVGRYEVMTTPSDRPWGPPVRIAAEVTGAGAVDLVLDDAPTLLAGRVTADGEPVAATVTLQMKAPTPGLTTIALARTDAQGHYRFPAYGGTGSGSFYVRVNPDASSGLAPEYFEDVADWGDARQVTVPTSEPLDFELEAALPADNTIRGRVTVDGESVQAVVRLYVEGANGGRRLIAPGWYRVTDGEGRFEVPDLPPGVYFVEASNPELPDRVLSFHPDVTALADARPVELVGATVAVADVALQRAPAVGGLVTGPDEQPLAGVSVTLEGRYPPSGQMFEGGTVTTGEDGRWRFRARTDLEYRVSFALDGYRTQWYDGAAREEDAVWVGAGDLAVDARLARTTSTPPTPPPWWQQLCANPPAKPPWLRALLRWACGAVPQ